MEIAFRVAQSSSILHGVFWGKFLPNTECLAIIKSHFIEIYQLTQDEKPLYCLLEQILGFEVSASSKLCIDSQDYLVLTSNGVIHVMEFVEDYFRSARHLDTGLQNIEKLNCVNHKIICSDNQKNLIVLSSDLTQILHHLQVQGSIFDWQIIGQDILILEYDTKERRIFWSELSSTFSYSTIKRDSILENYPRCFIYFNNFLLVFSDHKVQTFLYHQSKRQIELIEIKTLEGFFSSSSTIKSNLYISFDDGSIFVFDSTLNPTNIKIKQDSLLLGINSLLFYISHHGESGLIDLESSKINENYRSGCFIDGFFINEWNKFRCPVMICASVNFCSSQIIKIEKKCSDVLKHLNISDIAKYTKSACIVDGLLFLLPDLKVIDLNSFEICVISEIGLKDEKTLWVMKVQQGLAQVTENGVWAGNGERARFDQVCTAATGRDRVLVAGLVSQEVLVFVDLELKGKIGGVDFSALYLSLDFCVFVGLQQTGINKYSIQGDLLSTIETKGIVNSYIEKFNHLLIGTRDGFIEILSTESKTCIKLGENPVFLSESSQGIYTVSCKSYLIYNESLDFKRLQIPDSKFIIESKISISISKDLNFFNLEDDLRYSTSQEVLHTIPGQVNRLIKINENCVLFSYSHNQNFYLSVFDILLKRKLALLRVDSAIRCLLYIEENKKILTGNDDCQVNIYNLDLDLIANFVTHYKISVICYFEQYLYVAAKNILYCYRAESFEEMIYEFEKKYVMDIVDVAATKEFLVLALAFCGVRVVTRDKLQTVVKASKKLDFKKVMVSGEDFYAVSIDGWVLKGNLQGELQQLCYIGSGARVLAEGSLYSLNLLEPAQENLLVCALNGEILELYPKLKPELKSSAKELFERLSQRGIVDRNQIQELNLDILRLIIKLPDLNTEDSPIKDLLKLSA